MAGNGKRILVYGAGAIGRGYVPWLFDENDRLSFVEGNVALAHLIKTAGQFQTYQVKKEAYDVKVCKVDACYLPGEENTDNFDGIITAVGPRNAVRLASVLGSAKCPVLMFENDSSIPRKLSELTGKKDIFFGVPDVISSNTSAKEMLEEDPLALITEDGMCFADDRAVSLGGKINYVPETELSKQWIAKMYIHNTPHCIAAYLGAFQGFSFLHEGMSNPKIYKVVEGAMLEMGRTIVSGFGIDESFVNWYRDKELARFADRLLYDPISRVAREPFRKLGLTDRLLGAAQLALSNGVVPTNLIIGIIGAFSYKEKEDNDSHIMTLMNALTPSDFLKLIVNIQPHEALYKVILGNWDASMKALKELDE